MTLNLAQPFTSGQGAASLTESRCVPISYEYREFPKRQAEPPAALREARWVRERENAGRRQEDRWASPSSRAPESRDYGLPPTEMWSGRGRCEGKTKTG